MASGSVSQTLGLGDVVNNLTSTATDKPLSANMGKALNEAIAQSTAMVRHTITPILTPTRCDSFVTEERGGVVTMGIWNLSFSSPINTDTKIAELPYTLTQNCVFTCWDRLNRIVNGYINGSGEVYIRKYDGDLIYVSATFAKNSNK